MQIRVTMHTKHDIIATISKQYLPTVKFVQLFAYFRLIAEIIRKPGRVHILNITRINWLIQIIFGNDKNQFF